MRGEEGWRGREGEGELMTGSQTEGPGLQCACAVAKCIDNLPLLASTAPSGGSRPGSLWSLGQ